MNSSLGSPGGVGVGPWKNWKRDRIGKDERAPVSLVSLSLDQTEYKKRTTHVTSPTENLALSTQVQVKVPVDHFTTIDQLPDVDMGETGSGVFVGLVGR